MTFGKLILKQVLGFDVELVLYLRKGLQWVRSNSFLECVLLMLREHHRLNSLVRSVRDYRTSITVWRLLESRLLSQNWSFIDGPRGRLTSDSGRRFNGRTIRPDRWAIWTHHVTSHIFPVLLWFLYYRRLWWFARGVHLRLSLFWLKFSFLFRHFLISFEELRSFWPMIDRSPSPYTGVDPFINFVINLKSNHPGLSFIFL